MSTVGAAAGDGSVTNVAELGDLADARSSLSSLFGSTISMSGPVETRCGVVAVALTGNDEFMNDSGVFDAVVLHDLRWDGSSWADTPEELVPASTATSDWSVAVAVGRSAWVSAGRAAPDAIRLTVLDVWEEGAFGSIERLDESCRWVEATVLFPCGVDTFILGEFGRGEVRGGAPNEFVDDGSVLVSPFPAAAPIAIDDEPVQPPCHSDEEHVVRWQSAIGMFQALPAISTCPSGYVPEAGFPIRMCERGPLVSDVQEYLASSGFDVDVDGLFGPGTQRALVAFQQSTTGLAPIGAIDRATFDFIASGGGDF